MPSNDVLAALPPAAAFVLAELDRADEPLTRTEIEHRTGRSGGTLDDALRRLRTEGLITRHVPNGDARTTRYTTR